MSIKLDTSNETHQGDPNGTQGYLTACYRKHHRYQAFIFFEAKKDKIQHTLFHDELLLGLIDVVQRLHKLLTFL